MAGKRRGRGPWWRDAEGRWYATVGGKKVRFPADIGRRDEPRAWAHYEELMARLAQTRDGEADPTVARLARMHLDHLAAEAAAGGVSDEHAKARRGHLKHFLAFEKFGEEPARKLTPRDLARFCEAMVATPYKESYVVAMAASIHAAFNWASRPGSRSDGGALIAANPMVGAALPTVGRSPERFAERSTGAAWLAFLRRRCQGRNYRHANTRGGEPRNGVAFRDTPNGRRNRNFALLQRVLMHTGARPGELAVAEWSEVRWDAGRTADGRPYSLIVLPWWKWKNGKKTRKERTIYLSPVLSRALKREYARATRHKTHLFAARFGPWKTGSNLASRVKQLRPLAAEECNALAAAKGRPAPIAEEGPGRLVNYLWRHTAASTLLMLGVDMPSIAAALGTSAKMIEQRYGHILKEHVAEVAGLLAKGRRVSVSPAPRPSGAGA